MQKVQLSYSFDFCPMQPQFFQPEEGPKMNGHLLLFRLNGVVNPDRQPVFLNPGIIGFLICLRLSQANCREVSIAASA